VILWESAQKVGLVLEQLLVVLVASLCSTLWASGLAAQNCPPMAVRAPSQGALFQNRRICAATRCPELRRGPSSVRQRWGSLPWGLSICYFYFRFIFKSRETRRGAWEARSPSCCRLREPTGSRNCDCAARATYGEHSASPSARSHKAIEVQLRPCSRKNLRI
jgi:hypothetical protein